MNLICSICLEITLLKLLKWLPRTFELNLCFWYFHHIVPLYLCVSFSLLSVVLEPTRGKKQQGHNTRPDQDRELEIFPSDSDIQIDNDRATSTEFNNKIAAMPGNKSDPAFFSKTIYFHISRSGQHCPDSKVHGANMGPIWGRQDPGGPHVAPMNSAIWVTFFIANYV